MIAHQQLLNNYHGTSNEANMVAHTSVTTDPRSSHPSPTDSDPIKGTPSTGHTDSHSESSQASPGSTGALSGDDFPQDLSIPKSENKTSVIKSDKAVSEPLSSAELQCPKCGFPCNSEQMLKLHVQESHLMPVLRQFEPPRNDENAAISSLLSLQPPSSQPNPLDNIEFGLKIPTQNGMPKIFNPEAFCEICQKEFCNKYYLQTHKATKHGIPAMSGISLAASLSGLENPMISEPSVSLATPTAELRCPVCTQGPFGNPYLLQNHMLTFHNRSAASAAPPNPFAINPAIQAYLAAQLMGQFGVGGATLPTVSALPSQPNIMDSMKLMSGLLAPSQMPTPAFDQQTALARLAAMGLPPPVVTVPSTAMNGQMFEVPPVQSTASLTPTMTPNLHQSLSSSQLALSPASSKEAFCELCCKEFCNKYFLRTHKLKKHGIVTEETTSCRKRPSMSTEGTPPHSQMNSFIGPPENQTLNVTTISPVTQNSPVLTEALQKTPSYMLESQPTSVIVNGSTLVEPQIQQTLSEQVISPEAKVPKIEQPFDFQHIQPPMQQQTTRMSQLDQMMAAASAATPVSSTGNMSCNLCARSFPSMFSLVAHKYRDHGGHGLDGGIGIPTPVLTSAITPTKEPPQTNGHSPILQAVDPDAYCDLCKKEFCSKYFLRTHRLNIHGILDPNGSPGGSPSMMFQQGVITPNSAPPQRQKPRYVTGKNFCDICNKEVCNKYFLRTHMLKMHGIVIDENKTVIGNINTIDKEMMGGLIFRCDICQKELSTRNQVRHHKQTVHGVMPTAAEASMDMDSSLPTMVSTGNRPAPPNVTVSQDGSLQTNGVSDGALKPLDETDLSSRYFSHYTEVCPVCDRRFKSATWLQNHMRTDHAGEVSEELLNSFQKSAEELQEEIEQAKEEDQELGQQQADESMSTLFNQAINCDYCSEQFDDVIQLQVHVIGRHAAEIQTRANCLAEQAAIDSLSTNEMPPATPPPEEQPEIPRTNGLKTSPPLVIKRDGIKWYRCSYCHYYTRWLSNLSVHERRHTGTTSKDDKPFICPICLRAYRFAHSLERHKTVHRFMGLAHKPWATPDKSPKKGLNNDLDNSAESLESNVHYPTSQQAAAGAKRYRCTKCQKVFKSRELCRAHLFAIHRRQEWHAMMSPNKRLTNQRSPTKSTNHGPPPVVSEVVEELHQMSSLNNQIEIDEQSLSQEQPQGFGTPYSDENSTPKPYILQAFLMRQICENGKRVPALMPETMVYLPVTKRLYEPVETTLQLQPMEQIDSEIKTI